MSKCAAVVVLLLVVVDVSVGLYVDTVKVMREPFFKTKDLRETRRRFDEANEFDESEEFEGEEDSSEDAVALQVSYLDAVRAALLESSADFRGKGKKETNAFSKVINGLEREIANFQASLGRMAIPPDAVGQLEEFIGEAASVELKKNTKSLRSLTAHGLFAVEKSDVKLRVKRESDSALVEGASAFLENLRRRIGNTAFDEFLSIDGLVTLIFAIDDTGSMHEDIEAAVTIATDIVRRTREEEVDYLLSPINDPSTRDVTYKDSSKGEEFVELLRRLTAHAGGDCPEMAFTAMIDALDSGSIQPGSPMYVFTDASPKDATEENIKKLFSLANSYSSRIYFFSKGDCGAPSDLAVYERVANKTFGFVFPLQSTFDISQLAGMVCLGGLAEVTSGSSETGGSRRRRGLPSRYSIPADDSMGSLTIKVTVQIDLFGTTLLDPNGKTVTGGITLLKKMVYDIKNPVPGDYLLIVPASAGEHSYSVDTTSGLNIDFSHYYTYIARRGYIVPVPMDNPLQGITTTLFITVDGAEYVRSLTLTIKVVCTEDETVYFDQKLVPVGKSGARYMVKFKPPSCQFKLQLHGQTKEGYSFVRTSLGQDQAVPVMMRSSSTSLTDGLPAGQKTILPIQVRRGDTGDAIETYLVSLVDPLGYGRVLNPTRVVGSGRMGIVQLEFTVPADATKGKHVNVQVLLTKRGETKPIWPLPLHLTIN